MIPNDGYDKEAREKTNQAIKKHLVIFIHSLAIRFWYFFKKKKKQKQLKPILLVTGCVAQAESDEMIKRSNYIDGVIGPQSYHLLPEIIKKIVG